MIAYINARLNNILEPKLKSWADSNTVKSLRIIKWSSIAASIAIWSYLLIDWVIRAIQYFSLGIEFPRSAFIVEVILVSIALVPYYGYIFSDSALWRYKNIFK